MNPLILGSVLEIGKDLIGRFFPNKEEAARAEAEFLRMAAEGELKQIIGQLEINAREAQHASVWVAGWRPFFGWIGGAAFAYAVIGHNALSWVATINGWPMPPMMDHDLLWTVVTGMLGIGGLRTFEKTKGVTK